MKKTIIALAFALGGSALIAQQAGKPAATADPVIIKAGATEIRQSEFEHAVTALPAEYQSYATGPGKRQFAEDYLRLRMLSDIAEKAGLENDPKVQNQLKLLRQNTLANAQLEKMRATVEVSEGDLKKLYDDRKSSLERAKARHILIAFEGSPAAPEAGAPTEEAAKKKADELHAKIAAGADFAELAKTESHDAGSGAMGGDLGEFARGQMVPEFEKAVFETKVGELAPVTRTQFGFHIIQVQDRKAVAFDAVKPQLENQLRQEKLEALIEAMQTGAAASFDETYFGAPLPAAPALPAPGM